MDGGGGQEHSRGFTGQCGGGDKPVRQEYETGRADKQPTQSNQASKSEKCQD